jgi:hypothetical protein
LEQEHGLVLDIKVNARVLSQPEIDSFTNSKRLQGIKLILEIKKYFAVIETKLNTFNFQEIDEKLATPDLNRLNIYALDDEVAQKYDLTTSNEFVLLNSLFVVGRDLDYAKLADYIKSEYLHVKKLADNFNSKLKFLRKLVRICFC